MRGKKQTGAGLTPGQAGSQQCCAPTWSCQDASSRDAHPSRWGRGRLQVRIEVWLIVVTGYTPPYIFKECGRYRKRKSCKSMGNRSA